MQKPLPGVELQLGLGHADQLRGLFAREFYVFAGCHDICFIPYTILLCQENCCRLCPVAKEDPTPQAPLEYEIGTAASIPRPKLMCHYVT